MMGWDGGWGVGGWLVMGLMMLVVWIVPIALLVWLIVRNFQHDPGQTARSTPRSTADQILAERYARGEIDEEEFTRRSEVLRQGSRALS